MNLPDFKLRVLKQFGARMEHATPANVREFLDAIQLESWQAERSLSGPDSPDGVNHDGEVPYDLGPSVGPLTYETLLRDFFLNTLSASDDKAIIMLWIFALDLAYSGIEEMHSDSMNRLFRKG